MLEIENLSYSRNNFFIFENISFSIAKWVVGIIWASGSWKTTFLQTIWGFNKSEKWKILYNWKNIRSNILEYRRKNWFQFQDLNLIDLSVQENLKLPFLVWKSIVDKARIAELLEYFEISNLLKKNINEISWGEKKRVSLVKTFANKPNLVFLDEATASLDSYLKEKTFKFVKKYAEENIVFFVNHDENFKDFFEFKNTIYKNNFEILC